MKDKLPKLSDIKKRILALPKWGWGIILLSFLIIGVILGHTILLPVPGTTIMSLLVGIAIVEWIEDRISKK